MAEELQTQEKPSRYISSLKIETGKGFVIETAKDALGLVAFMADAGMLPRAYFETSSGAWKLSQAALALVGGIELGFSPIQAIKNVMVVNNTVTVWGAAALGLAKRSGLLEDHKQFFESEATDLTAVCYMRRRGELSGTEHRFSKSDALKANLLNKSGGTWGLYFKDMLMWKAVARALKANFGDVLNGAYITEEFMDMSRDFVEDSAADATTSKSARIASVVNEQMFER